ncbi:cell division protein FtsK [Bacillus pseudomycoides]|uniref:Cell division protein FtsK n=1 Tax=Bacillus pseudomycoides TaxID=64104 RepID=A0A1Y3MII2_9BACI|nr:DNA translocase FtsK [Bacillus pseudomycoides]OUM49846.1 cell division protein FtsK [Bacillus pseudomycoides]
MLDWMKKLFNKEEHQEEKAAINKAVPKNTESKPKIPRVNHYTEAREAQMASRNLGVKCRFPLIPDDGFDEENVEESTHFEQQPLPRVTNMERRRPRYVEEEPEPVHTFAPPKIEREIEPEPIVPKKSVPVQESRRRPFRPTEMISPIFGYKRPSREKQEVKTEEKGQEDLEISVEGKSVVDAWLEKKGYSISNFSDESFIPSKKQEKNLEHTGQQESPEEEKSVVDQWLEKNGYDSERSFTSLEGQEKVDVISDSLPFETDNLLHKSVGQDNKKEEHTVEIVQVFEQEPDVVALSQYDNEAKEEILQDELLDSTVENMDTASTEENEYKKEIEEEQLVEKTTLEENVVEVVEEAEEPTPEVEEVEEAEEPTPEVGEVEEAEEPTLEVGAVEEAEEPTPEVGAVEEAEEPTLEVGAVEEVEEPTPEVGAVEEAEEPTLEVEAVEEAEEPTPEVGEVEEAEEPTLEVEAVEEAEEPTLEVGEVEEAEEPTPEVEAVEEPEETLVAETFEEAKIAETAKESSEETAQVVVEKTTEQENLVSKAENNVSETSSAADEHTKEAVQNFANVLIEEAEEKQEVAVEQPVKQKEEPKREKKRHVPFNVVMLKQDRRKLIERHVAGMKTPQTPIKQAEEPVKVHEQSVQQVEEAPQGKAQTAQQVIVETQVEEKPVEQVIVETQVEEKPVEQVIVETQVEEKPVEQVIVETQVEEKPVERVIVETQVEEKPVERVAVEDQVTEEPVQQTEMKAPVASAGVQEKAYVIARRENDMRNVLQTPPEYAMPPLTLLTIPSQSTLDNTEWLEEQKELLDTTFNNFHVGAHVINVSQGPAVTRFEVQPDPGVKVNKITNLSDDIKLSLAAKDVRIEAPIPGKSAIGIEVPNKESKPVFLREILRSPVFTKSESPLTVALGLDISGAPIVTDIRKMPHGLIAGATGSGKSVCINAILTSILYKAKPHEVKLMLIDPKMVELAPYNSIPHLVAPVITDVKAATAALKWAVEEMEHRYELFAHAGARDLARYNTIVSSREIPGETLPYIVIVIDELADLMMVAPGDVEEAICRIAQKARACGIHLLVATQRPSVDVITGLIKSNIPTRIAFTVSSQVDSRTIIDIGGAEKLLGRGDMLFLGNGTSKPVRVQGVYVSDDEIEKTVEHVKKQMKPNYLFKQEDLLAKTEQHEAEDELFFDACQFVVEQGGASTSSVQRKFRIGYNRAARLIEEMEAQGIISEARGTKPRDVLISEDEFAAMQETNV